MTELVRLRLELSYDGTQFSGWAAQPGRRTVQGTVEQALRTVLRVPDLTLTVAGRTDAGVHASGQVAHVDVPLTAWLAGRDRVLSSLAAVLPDDVRATGIGEAPPGFDARFSALWRAYEYRICDAPSGVAPLRRAFVARWPRVLDADAMQSAGSALLGLHDFAAFCRRREGATTTRQLQRLDVWREADEVVFAVQADAFCHSMVRSLVGALLAVGEGRRPAWWPASLLGRDRRADDVVVAPAHGLRLVHVEYPVAAELAARAERTRARRADPAGGGRPRVVGIGAVCDLRIDAETSVSQQRFSVDEYVLLDDGSRVVIDERGLTMAANAGSVRAGLTEEVMRQQVLNVVLPDDDDSEDEHPWEWLAECAGRRGIAVTADQLRQLAYEVVLTERLTGWLAGLG